MSEDAHHTYLAAHEEFASSDVQYRDTRLTDEELERYLLERAETAETLVRPEATEIGDEKSFEMGSDPRTGGATNGANDGASNFVITCAKTDFQYLVEQSSFYANFNDSPVGGIWQLEAGSVDGQYYLKNVSSKDNQYLSGLAGGHINMTNEANRGLWEVKSYDGNKFKSFRSIAQGHFIAPYKFPDHWGLCWTLDETKFGTTTVSLGYSLVKEIVSNTFPTTDLVQLRDYSYFPTTYKMMRMIWENSTNTHNSNGIEACALVPMKKLEYKEGQFDCEDFSMVFQGRVLECCRNMSLGAKVNCCVGMAYGRVKTDRGWAAHMVNWSVSPSLEILLFEPQNGRLISHDHFRPERLSL